MTTPLNSVIARGILADRPAAGYAGRLYFTTDTGKLYRDSGVTWVEIQLGAPLSDDAAQALGTSASAGTSTLGSRSDHVHVKPSPADIGAATSGHTHTAPAWTDITSKPSTFTPSAHKTSHATGGSDALAASDIGAAASSHTHAESEVTNLVTDLAAKLTNPLGAVGDLITASTITYGTTNLCVTPSSGTVTATASSATGGGPAANAIDGDMATQWYCNGAPAGTWLKVQFSVPQSIGKVVLYSRPSDTFGYGEVELDNGTKTSFPTLSAGQSVTVTFPPTMVTWFKVNYLGGGNQNIGLKEAQAFYANTNLTPARVPVGTTGQVLTADSAQTLGIKWATPYADPLTTKGDLIVRSSSATGRLAVGTDGQLLLADSTATNGVKWGDTNPLSTKGDMIVGAGTSTIATNLARTPSSGTVTATASSSYSGSYLPANAIDGSMSTDWASLGYAAGQWIKLDWSVAQTISKVVLYSRNNGIDNNGNTELQFSDGTTVSLGNIGTGNATSTFTARTVTWMKVVSVSGGSGNAGYKEIEVYGVVAGAQVKLPVGTNGQVLTADSAQTVGVKWASVNADPAPGGANDDEFTTTSASTPSGWTAMGTLDTIDANTTASSTLYMRKAATTAVAEYGIYKASPSVPFTVTAKISDHNFTSAYQRASLFIGEATPGKLNTISAMYDTGGFSAQVLNYTNPTTWSSTVVSTLLNRTSAPFYIRIVITSATSVSFQWSFGGQIWNTISTRDPGFTIGSVGLSVSPQSSTAEAKACFDWIRFT